MKHVTGLAVCGFVVLATLLGVVSYYQTRGPSFHAISQSYTDNFFTACSITGTGSLSLRVLSDSSGTPVQGAQISAVLQTGCTIVGSGTENQVVYVDNFIQGQGGWLTPVLPDRAQSAGTFDFTVKYQGRTYNFSARISPVSLTCVTLHVPSGNVTAPSYFASSTGCASH